MSGQVNAGAGQIQTLCTTIETMDRLAQVGLNEIEAIARLALLSLETPDGQRNIENVALALHAIVQKADFTCDAITYEADEVGRGYRDDSRMRRAAARSAVLAELDPGPCWHGARGVRMSKPKRTPGNVPKPKGQAMAPEVPEVLPPDGWVKRSPLGFLGYAGGDLARLGDVLLWMERTKGLPRAVSVGELVRDMSEDVIASLYYISRADEFGGERYADLMPPDSTFSGPGSLPRPAWRTEEEHKASLEAARLARDPKTKTGRAALVEYLKRWATAPVMEQTDPVNKPTSHASRLAVPMHLAFRWWGYGQLVAQQAAPAGTDTTDTGSEPDVSTWAGLVAFNHAHPGVWTGEMEMTAAREEQRRKGKPGAKGVRIAMGSELTNTGPEKKGLSAKQIGEHIRRGLELITKDEAEEAAAKADAEKHRILENRRKSGGF